MVYASELASEHKQLTDIIDGLDPYSDWHVPMPNCLFFTSVFSAQQLSQQIENKLGVGPGKLYLITEVSGNKQGRLAERGWRLLNNPDNPRGS